MMNRRIMYRKVRAIVSPAVFSLAVMASFSAYADDITKVTKVTNVSNAKAVLIAGGDVWKCVAGQGEVERDGPTLKKNVTYRLYGMSSSDCRNGTGMAGLYDELLLQGTASVTIHITLYNSRFRYYWD